jgi:O-antigen ligase
MSLTGVAYLSVYFLGLILALLGRPIFGLYTYLFAFYLHAPSKWWGIGVPDIRWSLIAAVVALLAIFIHDRKNHEWLKKVEIKLFLFFVIFVWIQNLWALHPGLHFEFSILVTKFLILTYIIIATIKSNRDLYGFIIANILGTAYYGWIGITEHVGGRFESAGTPGMNDGNLLSLHMAPIFLTASYVLLTNSKYKKYILVPLILLTLNGIFLTQSRGGLLSIFISGVFALFFIPKKQSKQFKFFAILALVSGSILVGPALVDRLSSTYGDDGIQEKSAGSRIVFIKAQWAMFLNENPILGNGHRGTLLLSRVYIPSEYLTKIKGSDTSLRGSHNLLMSILVDQGLVGIVLYLSISIIIFRRFWRNRKLLKNSGSDDLVILYIGLNIGLMCYWVASMGVNSMRLEIDIWYYAVLSLLNVWLMNKYRNEGYR